MSLTLVISDCDSIVSQNAAMRAKGRPAALSDLQSEPERERGENIGGNDKSGYNNTFYNFSDGNVPPELSA